MTKVAKKECNHQFIVLRDDKKYKGNLLVGKLEEVYGIKCGCALCGQVRGVFEDGVIKIYYDGHPNTA